MLCTKVPGKLDGLNSDFSLTIVLGELQSVDGYMNIALEKCEEYVNGQKRRSYGDAFVRGNNGTRLWMCSWLELEANFCAVMYISADS